MGVSARRRVAQRQASIAKSFQAPVGGWNARDAIGAMPLSDACIMTNWFPGTSNVMMRYGHTQYATGISGQVEALLVYAGAAAVKMFAAAASGNIYDVSTAGAVGAAVVTGLTNGRFQYTDITTAGGSFMLAVNGANKLRGYNGSAWYIDGDGSHDISNVDTATCSGINLFKNRIWLTQDGTLDAWYLPTSAIAGAATKFPLGGIAQLGGALVAMATWTIDAGYGVDDLAVFVTTQGEVIVYKGTDPASATTWALVGVWALGAPVGKRCLYKYAGDLLYICQDGVVPMSGELQSSRTNPRVGLTDKITFAVSTAISQYGAYFGWQLMYFPKENQLFLNVPVTEGSDQQQYVMNTITRNWCNYTGWEANCWDLYNDNPYFGGDGFVGRAWNSLGDNGAEIPGFCIQAFSDFGTPGLQKRFTMMRPILYSDGSPSLFTEINVDFDLSDSTAALSNIAPSYGVWDVGLWDVALWGVGSAVLQQWQGCTGIGYYGAVVMKAATLGIQVQWNSTTVVFERGAIL